MFTSLETRYRSMDHLSFLSGFSIQFRMIDDSMYQLKTSLISPCSPDEAFRFFEDPLNLSRITPEWLDFRIVDTESVKEIFEGAVFDFTIRWLGFRFKWQSKIIEYRPPEKFVDSQVMGPYTYWRHLHLFEKISGGTILKDEVTYKLPLGLLGRLVHILVKRQLEDIFCYRAARISEWTRK